MLERLVNKKLDLLPSLTATSPCPPPLRPPTAGLPNQYYADSSTDEAPSGSGYGSGSGEGWEWDSWGEEDRRRRQWRQS